MSQDVSRRMERLARGQAGKPASHESTKLCVLRLLSLSLSCILALHLNAAGDSVDP